MYFLQVMDDNFVGRHFVKSHFKKIGKNNVQTLQKFLLYKFMKFLMQMMVWYLYSTQMPFFIFASFVSLSALACVFCQILYQVELQIVQSVLSTLDDGGLGYQGTMFRVANGNASKKIQVQCVEKFMMCDVII
eukprot:TRINITY_DN557_c0_g1_i4.p6 TRINITY_DN557_c0_g1~~TRINITY_DN557_c0_g1_i4.p6  ORF type:complete len:133 (-),score=2.99 TRINITY_DN557_c0_g1_i4:260-658(-)